MTVKVQAYEHDGVLFRTSEEVLNYKAKRALQDAYRNDRSYFDNRFLAVLDDPYKTYLILKEFYGDR